MARSKNPDNYPPYYREALLGVARCGTPLALNVPDGMRLRQRLYAYINALEAHEERNSIPYAFRDSLKMRQVNITSRDGAVWLESKQHGVEADAFRQALSTLPQVPHAEEIDAILAGGSDGSPDDVSYAALLNAGRTAEPGHDPDSPPRSLEAILELAAKAGDIK